MEDQSKSVTPWTAFQQQHSSSLQLGQSTAEGASRHSSGEHPQSAQRMTNFVFADGNAGEGTALSYTPNRATTGRFI